MNANPQFLAQEFNAASAHVDEAAIKPLPNSRKVYVQGSRPDIRVPTPIPAPASKRTRPSMYTTAPAPTPTRP
jgi:hypothetical protein